MLQSRASTRDSDRRHATFGDRRLFALWRIPRSSVPLILGVEIAAVTWLIAANLTQTVDSSDIGRFALLTAMVLVYGEAARRVELLRRFLRRHLGDSSSADMSSLWSFAAALVLPTGLAGLLVVVLYGHSIARSPRDGGTPLYRSVFTAAADGFAVLAASTAGAAVGELGEGLADGATGAFAVTVALVTYAAANQATMAVAIYLSRPRPRRLRECWLSREDESTELATLVLAVLFALVVVRAPLLSPAVLLLALVLSRSALVRELQERASRDTKTGLLNAGAWRQYADVEVARRAQGTTRVAVLMIDLDHFKLLNDEFGHQAGDAALKAVADCVSDALRGNDAVGRYGGEEFIALLVDADEESSTVVAERICERIRTLQTAHGGTVTASIGISVGHPDRHDLDLLIGAADKALYEAKAAGRDRVALRLMEPAALHPELTD